MTVVTNLNEKRREKQRFHEMKMLRELSLNEIIAEVTRCFEGFIQEESFYKTAMEDICIDMAIDTYLSGTGYSRFGFYGEPKERVRKRAEEEIEEITRVLYDHMMYYNAADDLVSESLFSACAHFTGYWWEHGFVIGKKRYSLRLH